ncbi:MAG: hypothetical protein JWN39_2423 [Ilumatobacteraceae bacterium]|nr:hypothetical protein [Ilumatobacteraceae bacterium]
MKLLRHFLAVAIAVGLVVALGFAWSASGVAGLVSDDGGDRQFAPARPGGRRVLDQRGAGGFSLSHADDLVQTLMILALITAAVVVIDKARRRYRPSRFPPRRSASDS